MEASKLSMEQTKAVEAVKNGCNIFLTGAAGTGKSVTLARIREVLEEVHGPDTVMVTSPTGISAILVGGATIYSAFKIHPTAVAEDRMKICKVWKDIEALVIDEVSMLDPRLFGYLNRQAKLSRSSTDPFGGVQVVCIGDFFQLPPVLKDKPELEFVFETLDWKELDMEMIELKTVHRQTDKTFVALLDRLRQGKLTSTDADLICGLRKRKRSGKDEVADESEEIRPTKLFCKRLSEERSNAKELAKIKAPLKSFTLSKEVESTGRVARFTEKQKSLICSKVLKHFMVPEVLELKVGAQVMLLANLCLSKGLANGARGVVTGFEEEGWPIIKFDTVQQCVIRPHKWEIKAERGITVSIVAVPLKLAWAITIHKSQGQSIDRLEVDLSDAFAYGQVYTALSRARSMDNLVVTNFNSSNVKAHPKVSAFYLE